MKEPKAKPPLPRSAGQMTLVEAKNGRVSCKCSCGRSHQTYSEIYYRKSAKQNVDLRCRVCMNEVLASKGPYRRRERFLSPLNSTLRRSSL